MVTAAEIVGGLRDGMEWDGIGVKTRRAGCGSLAALKEEEMVGTDIAH